MISTAATLMIKKQATSIQQKYDTQSKCEDIHVIYNDTQLEDVAIDDWYNYYQGSHHEVVSGMLKCFCS
jgi:hypothetical protein